MLSGSAADGVYRDLLMDERKRIELAVVEGERQLAEQEARRLKKQDGDVSQAELTLEMMRETQQRNEHVANASCLCCSPNSGI